MADPGSSLASVLNQSTLATVGETLQEGISSILENVEEIAGGSEAELPELQIPDAFVEAVEEQAGAELDPDAADPEAEAETPAVETPAPEVEAPAVEEAEVPETSEAETPEVDVEAPEAEVPSVETEPETPDDSENTETTEENGNNPEGFEWGNGNGEVPPGQNVDEDGNIVNNGGHMPPGLNRGEKPDKDDNPNPPEVPEDPGTEDSSDKSANKANKGTHIYIYDELNRMVTSNIAKELTTYTYDTLGNLVGESVKNKSVDYQYNELNQLVYRKDSQNQEYTYTYDKRGNRVAETGKKESRAFVYDETNRLVEGTNWKGDKSSYTYNGLGVRINNTQTSHSGSVYSRDYVIDYTSLERDDLMVYAEGGGQLDYVQREVYAGSERIEQFTDRSNGGYERLLYVHEDLQGNTRYYTKDNGQSFAELTYDAWGMPESPNKLLNNDHGNYVYATYTGHIFDTTLDIYFAEARFYDAQTRQWLAMDPIKDGGNWYQYCGSNPLRYWDPLGLSGFVIYGCNAELRNELEILSEEHFTELFGEGLKRFIKIQLNVYSSDEIFDFIVSNDDIITSSAEKYNVPKEYIQAILYREMRFIDKRDIISDSIVYVSLNAHLAQEKLIEDGNYLGAQGITIPFVQKYTDSSTGVSQIFAQTAMNAISVAIKEGITSKEDLGIPSDMVIDTENGDIESINYIWNKLHNDVEFNIAAETLNIYSSALEVVGSTDFENFNEEETRNVLARYNGPLEVSGKANQPALTYGDQVYELYEVFKNNPIIQE